MPSCAIIKCLNRTGKVGGVNRGITYHRFPNDPHIRIKWIEATGRKNWLPAKYSHICSVHFHEDTFTGPSKYRRLIKTAYPTIDINGQPSSEMDCNKKTQRKRKLEEVINEPSTSDEIPIHMPEKKKFLDQLKKAKQVIKDKDKEIKRLKEQNRRKVKKILTLVTLLTCLKKNTLITDEQAECLKSTNVATKELYSRQMKNAKGSVTT